MAISMYTYVCLEYYYSLTHSYLHTKINKSLKIIVYEVDGDNLEGNLKPLKF